jgi:hypothetical protein
MIVITIIVTVADLINKNNTKKYYKYERNINNNKIILKVLLGD